LNFPVRWLVQGVFEKTITTARESVVLMHVWFFFNMRKSHWWYLGSVH